MTHRTGKTTRLLAELDAAALSGRFSTLWVTDATLRELVRRRDEYGAELHFPDSVPATLRGVPIRVLHVM